MIIIVNLHIPAGNTRVHYNIELLENNAVEIILYNKYNLVVRANKLCVSVGQCVDNAIRSIDTLSLSL